MADPNWYPDPAGRFELRYYDGVQWTAHVATNGVTATDPPGQAPPATSGHADGAGPGSELSGQEAPSAVGQPPHQPNQLHDGLYPAQDGLRPPGTTSSGQSSGLFGLLAALVAVVALVAGGVYLLVAGSDDDEGIEAVVDQGATSDAGTDDDDEATETSNTTSASSTTATTTITTASSTTATPAAGLPAPADARAEIAEYGSDAELDGLADDCQAGDMGACDGLYRDSAIGSGYEAYGDSCGGRNEPAGYCAAIYASS